MSAQYRAAYRSILRELAKSSIAEPPKRNRAIVQSFRSIFECHLVNTDANDEKFLRDMRNTIIFLRSQRLHKELLDRYNPLHDMSQEERIHATARRVGLDVPIEAKPDGSEEK